MLMPKPLGASNAGTGFASALLTVFSVLPKPYIATPACARRCFPIRPSLPSGAAIVGPPGGGDGSLTVTPLLYCCAFATKPTAGGTLVSTG